MEARNRLSPEAEQFRDQQGCESIGLSEANVLIIEDAPGMREFLQTVLSDCGYRAAGVPSGLDGMTVIEQFSNPQQVVTGFDLIVLDWCLPGMTGGEVLKWIRDNDMSVPVLVISSFFGSEVLEEATRLGAPIVLSKPFRINDFIKSVKALTT